MKIRTGYVSNSSSASFMIPSFLLTDEQKELLLALDCGKKMKADLQEKLGDNKCNWEDSKNDYPRNEQFHAVYEEMEKNGDFYDNWDIGEKHESVAGSAWMDNGCLKDLMKKIGFDLTAIHWDTTCGFERATNPEAVKFFIEQHHKWFKKLTKDDIKFEEEQQDCNITEKSIYEMTEAELKKAHEEEE